MAEKKDCINCIKYENGECILGYATKGDCEKYEDK